jgi:hypothetical protein
MGPPSHTAKLLHPLWGAAPPHPALRTDTVGLHGTEVLLEAVTVCITQILNADSLRDALTEALQTIAKVVQIDPMVVIEKVPAGNAEPAPDFVFVWNSDAASKIALIVTNIAMTIIVTITATTIEKSQR